MTQPITPICYCFDWTKEKIKQYVEKGLTPNPVEHIRENIKENRCGCDVNNPQGSCCLGKCYKLYERTNLICIYSIKGRFPAVRISAYFNFRARFLSNSCKGNGYIKV